MNGLPSNNDPTYLVCVNKENYSITALTFAAKLAKSNNGKIVILHVIEPADFLSIGIVAKKMLTEQRNDAKSLMRKYSNMVKKLGDIQLSIILKEGRIEDEIIDVLENNSSISMFIVGAAYEHAKSKTLHPIVSQLGAKIHIPMLIIPGNITELQMDELTS